MPELKITPIIPEDDDPPDRQRPSRPRAPRPAARTPADQPAEPGSQEPMTPEEIEAVEEELRRRYGLKDFKFEELAPSRAGSQSHKTGVTRK